MDISTKPGPMPSARTDAKVKLSVCVVSYNTRDMLRECLKSVFDRTPGLSLEVIVVDNASRDGSVEMVAREFPQVRLIANAENRRFAIGNNQALREATGEYLLLLNSDTIVLDPALVKMTEFMDAHPDVGALGVRLVTREGAPSMSFGLYPSIKNTLAFSSGLARRFIRSPLYRSDGFYVDEIVEPVEIDYVVGACLMTRRAALDRVGLLDESFWFYGEELDFCWRLRRAGWKSMLIPVSLIHIGGGSQTTPDWRVATWSTMAAWQFVRKNRSRLYRILYISCDLAVMFYQTLAMLLKRALGRCTAAELSVALRRTGAVLKAAWKREYRGRTSGP